MNENARHEALRRLLRAGDPLPPGERLSGAEAHGIRRQVLAAAPRFTRRRQWRTALAAAAVVAVTAGVSLLRPGLPRPAEHPAGSSPPTTAEAAQARDRQVHLVTRGGTRVIWVLKADHD